MASDDVVARLHVIAARELHPFSARLVRLTAQPLFLPVVDLAVTRTVYERTVLIGDAAFVVRPHTAGGAAKAARDAQSIAHALSSPKSAIDVSLADFEREQLAYGQQMLKYGIDLGRRWARL